MIEILQYDFMQRALLAGVIVGVIAPVIGTFLVAKRYALFADSLAHVSLAGIAIGLLAGINPIIGALGVALAASISMERLRSSRLLSGEMALAMFLSGGLALAIVLIGIGKGFSVDLFSYLFGSITTVQPPDLAIIAGLGLLVLGTVMLLYKELFYLAIDQESAVVSGINTKVLNTLLIALAAVTVVLSIRIVGALLIGALIVIPVATAMQVARSFRGTMLLAVGLSELAVIAGLVAAYYLNTAAGGTIVLAALVIFIAVIGTKRFRS